MGGQQTFALFLSYYDSVIWSVICNGFYYIIGTGLMGSTGDFLVISKLEKNPAELSVLYRWLYMIRVKGTITDLQELTRTH